MADDDGIYIDIIPRVDETALGRVTKRLESAGDVIGAAMGSKAGKMISEKVGDALSSGEFGGKWGKVLGDLLGGSATSSSRLSGSGAKTSSRRRSGPRKTSNGGRASSPRKTTNGGKTANDIGDKVGDAVAAKLDDVVKRFDIDNIGKENLEKVAEVIGDKINEVADKIGVNVTDVLGKARETVGDIREHIAGAKLGVGALALDVGAQAARSHDMGTLGDVLGEGSKIAGAAAMGAEFGSIVPGVGTLIGAGGGATIQAFVDLFNEERHRAESNALKLPGIGATAVLDNDQVGAAGGVGASPRNPFGLVTTRPHAGAGAAGGFAQQGPVNLSAGSAGANAILGTGSTKFEKVVLPSASAPSSVSTGEMDVTAGTVVVNGGGSRRDTGETAGSGGGRFPRGSRGGAKTRGGKPSGVGGAAAFAGFDSGGIVPGGSGPGFDNMIGILPSGRAIGMESGEGVVNDAAMSRPGVPALIASLNRGFKTGTKTTGGVSGGGNAHAPNPSSFNASVGSAVHGPNQFGAGPGNGPHEAAPEATFSVKPGSHQNTKPKAPHEITPTGHGKGFGIGGGIIGAAEGAGEAAAGLFGGPGGGAAASIAAQEANRAVGALGQMAATLAFELPIDTFWLSDSQLSDPSHSWFGKIGLSLVGEHLNAKNMAGMTKAPLSNTNAKRNPAGGGAVGSAPMVHIENQWNASNVEHNTNNMDLVTQMGAYDTSMSPSPINYHHQGSPFTMMSGG